MKIQSIKTIFLALTILVASQPSFAMRKSQGRPGHSLDQVTAVLSAFSYAFYKVYTKTCELLENSNPCFYENPDFPSDGITFQSQAGASFFVANEHLNSLKQLAPTIANMFSDIEGTSVTIFPLHVSNHALYVLTQMARGNFDLLDYVRKLSVEEIEELKKEAQFLDSQALRNLVADAINPFEHLPNEDLVAIMKRVTPEDRTACWSVSKQFRGLLNRTQMPVSHGGFGWTDTLPVVAGIQVGALPSTPVAVGQFLYVANILSGTISVINTNNNEVIATIPVGSPETPIAIGNLLYVPNSDHGTVSVIDTRSNEVVATIPVGRRPLTPVAVGHLLYVPNSDDGTVSVIDTSSNEVVATIPVGERPLTPVAVGHLLYVPDNYGRTVWVIDTTLNEVVGRIRVGFQPTTPVAVGHLLYVPNSQDNTISVIDTTLNQVVETIKVGAGPSTPVAVGHLLYVPNTGEDTVSVIDTTVNQVVDTIEVGRRPTTPVVVGDFLFVNSADGISVIDTTSNKVVATIQITGSRPVAVGRFLYVPCRAIWVIDLGGYMPGQSLL